MAKVYTEEELNSFQPLGVRYSKPGIKVLRDRHDIIEEKLFKSV